MIKYNDNRIRELRNYLDNTCYDIMNIFINGESNYFLDPWQNYEILNGNILDLDDKRRVIFKFLMLGNELQYSDVIHAMGESIVNLLLDLRFAIKTGDKIKSNGYSILSYLDNYFVVGIPYFYPNCDNKEPAVYIGADSYRLSRLLPSKKASLTLDLCTGSGIQAILQARNSEKVIGVEFNQQAIPVSRFNVELNHVKNIVDIRNGNLYEPVKNMTFDVITSNPPFIPVPKDVDYPIAGDGGEDGLYVIKKIIEGYDKHLVDGGYGLMIGEAIGNKEIPFLIKILQEILKNNYETTIILSAKIPIDIQVDTITSFIKNTNKINLTKLELKNKWKLLYKRLNASFYYVFTLKTKKVKSKSGKLEVLDLTNKWVPDDIPICCEKYSLEKIKDIYGVIINGEMVSAIDNEAADFIRYCNGNYTITDIIEIIKEKYFSKYGDFYYVKMIENALNVCYILQRNNVISKCER